MAVPHLSHFRGVRFLQVRHPLAVVSSFTGTRFFTRPPKAQNRYASRWFDPVGDDVLDAMRWWVRWNELAEPHADFVVPLEAIDERMLASMLRRIGVVGDVDARAERAFAAVATNVNAERSAGKLELGWGDLPVGPERDALARCARRFGYEPEVSEVAQLVSSRLP
jgi:hypothetical protein